MRKGLIVLFGSWLVLGSACARQIPTAVIASTPAVKSASVQAASLTVMRNPEAGPSLLGSFNLINGRQSTETLRFFGARNNLSQVTVQVGHDPARTLSPFEAGRYGQLLAYARPDASTRELQNLLEGWARKKAAAKPVQAAAAPIRR